MATIQLFGIEKSKEAVSLILDLAKEGIEAGKDGWQFTDALRFLGYTGKINDTIKSFPQIKKELGEVSPEERTAFYQYFVVKFDIPNDKVEAFIEHAVDYGVRTFAHIEEGIELSKEFKALKPAVPVTP